MKLIKSSPDQLIKQPSYYVVDHDNHKVIKIRANGQVINVGMFERTYQKYVVEFLLPKYRSATYLEILVVTGWSKQRIYDYINSEIMVQCAEGQVWPREFEKRGITPPSVQLWDPDAESDWL